MKITTHLDSREFDQPARHGFLRVPYPTQWIPSRLRPLCEQIEIWRAEFGMPFIVISGYRTLEYNRVVGGKPASQHLVGRAADIRCPGVPASDLHAAALRLYREGKLKIGGLGIYASFVHLDIRPHWRLVRWVGGSRNL